MSSLDKRQWARDLLAEFNNTKPVDELVAFVWGWEQEESGAENESGAEYNPLNTTEKMTGSTDFNSAGVQNYTSYEQGLQATYQTLTNGLYTTLVYALNANDNIQITHPNILNDLSVWVSGNRTPIAESYVASIFQLAKERLADIQKGDTMIPEVAHFVDVSQFWPGKTEFACGFYAASTVKYAGKDAPLGSSHDVEVWADEQYREEYGEDTPTDTGGVSVDDMHRLIEASAGSIEGQHYQDITAITTNSKQSSDIAHVKAALEQGYPVIATILESSVFDKDLQRNPYWWGASGTHVFVITGMQDDSTYLVRDSANVVGSLQGPNTVQTGPRKYDATQVAIYWATKVQTSWLPPIQAEDTNSKGDDFSMQAIDWNKQLQAGSAEAQQASDTWASSGLPHDTGIADAWQRAYANGIIMGPPAGKEIHTTDWNKQPIVVQYFQMGFRVEYPAGNQGGHPRLFFLNQELKWEN